MASSNDRPIQGQDRFQVPFYCLDEQVSPDADVRIIEAFVHSLKLEELGFGKTQTAVTGRKPFHPSALLKLYLYGYMHDIRFSRKRQQIVEPACRMA
jgi:transposase